MPMQIETIEIKNYRLFQDVKVKNLPRLSAFVGANGTGKSTFFDVFSFLKDALTHNVSKAVSKRGGFKELISRGAKDNTISFVVRFRIPSGYLASYFLDITMKDGKVAISKEKLWYRRGGGGRGQPYRWLEFSYGKGKAITNESIALEDPNKIERKEYVLDDQDILAIKGLGQFREFPVISEFRQLIESWYISDFNISKARPSVEDGFAEHLSALGDNVALVAQYLYENHRDRFNRILEAMKRRVPGVEKVSATPTVDGRLVLSFQDESFKDPFVARFVSDGTIKMFAYLVLLNDPKPFPLLAVEEPENQLYPELLPELAEEFRSYAEAGGQVFLSTHSPDLLNGLNLEEIFWLEKQQGYTKIHRASDDELLRNLVREGDRPGALWTQGFFGGVGLR